MAAEPQKFKKTKEIGRKDILLSLARVPETGQVYLGSSDAKIYSLDMAAEKPEADEGRAGHKGYVMGVALAGEHLVSGAYDRKLIWWKTDSAEPVRTVDAHSKWIRKVVASPDGKLVASIADDMVCKLWDAASGKLVHELRGHKEQTPNNYPSMFYACAFSPDGVHLATADKVGQVYVWEVASGKQVCGFVAPEHYTWDPRQRRHSIGGVRSLAFSPDGKTLAIGGMGKVGNIDHLGGKALLHLFDWQKQEQLAELKSDKFKGLIQQLHYHHEGKWLLASGGDNSGFLWFINPADNKTLHEEKAPMHIHSVALSEGSDTIFACGHGKVAMFSAS